MAKQKKEEELADSAKPKKRGPKPKGVKATPKPRLKSENPVGRPKVPEEKRKIILDCLRKGNTKRDSCLAASIHRDTFAEWIRKATEAHEDGVENEYTVFSDQVNQAMAEARRYALECWQKHMPTDWRASMAYLERTDPEHYRLNQKMDVTQTVEVSQKAILEIPDNGNR